MTFVLAAVSVERLTTTCGQDPGWVCRHVLDTTHSDTLASGASWIVGAPLRILAIVVGAFIVNRLARRAVRRGLRRLHAGGVTERLSALRRRAPSALTETGEMSLRAEQRIEALAGLLRSVISFVIWVLAAFMILDQVGIDLAPLLAGAGIVGVALGFGSQSLVKDFLSGIFILAEDQFGVGDIVDVGEATGTVEAVSLRSTRLRSIDGVVWHVPNGEIRRVGNMSQHWSRALIDVGVGYGSDLEVAQQAIKQAADEVWKADDHVIEEPEVWGVQDLGLHAVSIRLVVKTTPAEQYRISRALRGRIKRALDAEGIEMPSPVAAVVPPPA